MLVVDRAADVADERTDTILRWLCDEVGSILRVPAPRPDDDFFDLGGDSMSALALFGAVEERFGCTIPLTTIYDAPRIVALATRIASTSTRQSATSCIVPIKAAPPGSGVVVLIHGVGGHVFDLLRLGGLIETSHSVIAMRAHGLERGEMPLDRVEAMADAYAALILAEFPDQIVHLIGYSFGGMVALELSRRLRAADTPVGSVVLLDSYPHPQRWPRRQALDVRLRRIRNQLSVLRSSDWPARLAYCRSRLGFGDSNATSTSSRSQWLAAPVGATPDIRAVFDAASVAIDHYQPTIFDHPVTFMRPEIASVFLPTQPRAVWQPLIPCFDVQIVPGDHVTMLDDHAADLAVLLSRTIARSNQHPA
ncbi:alpha/beta fold hydrolase [Acidiphilium sp. PA]|uniref:thioesterase domain-containing protein n=1 Tax=Acidiphilium sp. PA TaxID=2871705 RepID=UPI00224319A4|nr:alpha/beta fold hydrolase [Acidiphilium sp. PA]MCW8308611.1 alpha/beta fold hydrolase [Acidiphilium sp. PA]